MCARQLSRARFLSSERRIYHGACLVSVAFEHHVPGAGILEPLAARGKIHRAEFPLAKRIVDSRLEAAFLFLVAHFQPDFDELNAAVHFVFLVGDIT